jgi:hypothetical protein
VVPAEEAVPPEVVLVVEVPPELLSLPPELVDVVALSPVVESLVVPSELDEEEEESPLPPLSPQAGSRVRANRMEG